MSTHYVWLHDEIKNIFSVNVLTFQILYSALFCLIFFSSCFLKYLVLANIVDPDQTAPSGAVWSGPTLFEYAVLLETLVNEILRYYCT